MSKYPFEYNYDMSDLIDHKMEDIRTSMVREIVRRVNNGEIVKLTCDERTLGYFGPNWYGLREELPNG